MKYDKSFTGVINSRQVVANIILFRSPFDKPSNVRWSLFCHFENDEEGETLEQINNSREESFTISPNPYDSGDPTIIIEKAEKFLIALGFAEVK